MGDFFDDFSTKAVLSEACIARLNDLLVALSSEGSAPQAGQARYAELLKALLAEQGADLEGARAANPGFAYVEAALDAEAFKGLLAQTAAAAECATKAAAEAELAKAQGEEAKGTWSPPPADADPETGEDMA